VLLTAEGRAKASLVAFDFLRLDGDDMGERPIERGASRSRGSLQAPTGPAPNAPSAPAPRRSPAFPALTKKRRLQFEAPRFLRLCGGVERFLGWRSVRRIALQQNRAADEVARLELDQPEDHVAVALTRPVQRSELADPLRFEPD
jgi:hypothetical protein